MYQCVGGKGMQLVEITYKRQEDDQLYSAVITERQSRDIKVLPHITIISTRSVPADTPRDYILK